MALWGAEWLVKVDEGKRAVPAFSFLLAQPLPVRTTLLAIVDAVRATGPDRWMDAGTHRPMKGEIDHLHEARDKHGETLYRLFLMWDRPAHKVTFIDGRFKPNNTVLDANDYDAIRELAATIGDANLVATADDFARLLLEDG